MLWRGGILGGSLGATVWVLWGSDGVPWVQWGGSWGAGGGHWVLWGSAGVPWVQWGGSLGCWGGHWGAGGGSLGAAREGRLPCREFHGCWMGGFPRVLWRGPPNFGDLTPFSSPPPQLVVGIPRDAGGPRLTVVRGAGILTSLALPEAPAGLGAFGVTPLGGGGNLGGPGGAPALVVAAGSALYVYRNLRPFYKYSLPPQPPHPLERDLWLQAAQVRVPPLPEHPWVLLGSP